MFLISSCLEHLQRWFSRTEDYHLQMRKIVNLSFLQFFTITNVLFFILQPVQTPTRCTTCFIQRIQSQPVWNQYYLQGFRCCLRLMQRGILNIRQAMGNPITCVSLFTLCIYQELCCSPKLYSNIYIFIVSVETLQSNPQVFSDIAPRRLSEVSLQSTVSGIIDNIPLQQINSRKCDQ